MDDAGLARAHEENHAYWWTVDALVHGQSRETVPGCLWAGPQQTGGEGEGSLHRIRWAGGEDIRGKLAPLVRDCASADRRLHAHLTQNSSPPDMLRQLRGLGFQHLRKYPVLAADLTALGTAAPAEALKPREVADLGEFGPDRPHPGLGQLHTRGQKRIAQQLTARIAASGGAIRHIVLSGDTGDVGAFTLIERGGIAGLYDVVLAEGHRNAAALRAAGQAAMAAALAAGIPAMAMIKDRTEEPAFRALGFREVGWLSWLVLHRSRLADWPLANARR